MSQTPSMSDPDDALQRLARLNLQRKGKYAMDNLAEPYQKPVTKGEARQRVPNELLLKIVDYFIPDTGLCLSNDPEKYKDFQTVKSLARTSHLLRDEVFKRVLSRPLHLEITNGYSCHCQQYCHPKHILRTDPWRELKFLPFQRWKNMTVTFAPNIDNPCCYVEERELIRKPFRPADKYEDRFMAAILCLVRQSYCIGTMLRDQSLSATRRLDPEFINFVFKDFWSNPLPEATRKAELLHLGNDLFADPGDVEPMEEIETEPMWNLECIVGLLVHWKWTCYMASRPSAVPHLSFPKFSLSFRDQWAWSRYQMLRDDPRVLDVVANDIQYEFEDWWLNMPPCQWGQIDPRTMLYFAVNRWEKFFGGFLGYGMRSFAFSEWRFDYYTHNLCVKVEDRQDEWGIWRRHWSVPCRFERKYVRH